ncbi:four-carbon acid sugar kinase family protein [Bosea sp. (in: a-proteobacteria)]|uniref:four-carbon acid sugar kinase family protein n=1 Tax=Bosea sp. (in: a-proteobacteria) TaxID=1871050 RepID=UPI001ACA03C0|nr:four-carbon acid sugar kinase family protein [Bosea sp. (in: a-proteobacteria)]MBN9444649.1 four-carbon acid sugar kinase family protein [Bosea sp. (in: a-proteobacteria)]
MAERAPVYGWFGDDFTGATDTLATLAERGFRALLFLGIPTPEHLAAAGPLDAIGIAGATRSLPPAAMDPILDEAGRFFAERGVRIMHYKCCSTFDSAPHVGSIGAAASAFRRHFPEGPIIIIGGQPNLGRYCLFGQLFAAAGDGEVHRIDRHPTMSRHPVTPMTEPDLRLHLALQGLRSIALVSYLELEGDVPSTAAYEGITLYDVSRESDLNAIARRLRSRFETGSGLFIGASSVARIAGELRRRTPQIPAYQPIGRAKGPVLALVGSLSPVTRAQVKAAEGFARLPIDTARLRDDPSYGHGLYEQAVRSIASGHTMLVTEAPEAVADAPRSVAAATGQLLRSIVDRANIARLLVAGGDTSTLAIEALDIWGLSYRAPLVEGAPVCRAHSAGNRLDGLEIVLKGGQMGPPEFFRLASG